MLFGEKVLSVGIDIGGSNVRVGYWMKLALFNISKCLVLIYVVFLSFSLIFVPVEIGVSVGDVGVGFEWVVLPSRFPNNMTVCFHVGSEFLYGVREIVVFIPLDEHGVNVYFIDWVWIGREGWIVHEGYDEADDGYPDYYVFTAETINDTINPGESCLITFHVSEPVLEGTYTWIFEVTDVKGQTQIISLNHTFIIPPPSITKIFPAYGEQGETLNVTILGGNFTKGCNVSFEPVNGITINSITFINDSELRVNITISENATIGPRDVKVTNPDGKSDKLEDGFKVVEKCHKAKEIAKEAKAIAEKAREIVNRARQKLVGAEETLNNFSANLQKLIEKLEKTIGDIEKLLSIISEVKSKFRELEKVVEEAKKAVNRARDTVRSVRGSTEAANFLLRKPLSSALKTLEAALKNMESSLKAIQYYLKSASKAIEKADEIASKAKELIETLKNSISKAKKFLEEINELKDTVLKSAKKTLLDAEKETENAEKAAEEAGLAAEKHDVEAALKALEKARKAAQRVEEKSLEIEKLVEKMVNKVNELNKAAEAIQKSLSEIEDTLNSFENEVNKIKDNVIKMLDNAKNIFRYIKKVADQIGGWGTKLLAKIASAAGWIAKAALAVVLVVSLIPELIAWLASLLKFAPALAPAIAFLTIPSIPALRHVQWKIGVKLGLIAGLPSIILLAATLTPPIFLIYSSTEAIILTAFSITIIAAIHIAIGLIFTALYRKLPSEKPIVKGAFLGLIIWVINLISALNNPELLLTILNFIGSILYGIALGLIWTRLNESTNESSLNRQV